MEKHTSRTMRLGIFVTAGIVLFITAIYFIGKQQNLFGSNTHLSAIFADVGGLQPGNNVRFSGINIGTVEDIEIISDSSARVDIIIDKKVLPHIKKDSKAVIGSEGLMGNKTINILPGSAQVPAIAENGFLETSSMFDMDGIMKHLEKTTKNSSEITTDLADILHNIRTGKGTFGKLIQDSGVAEDFATSMRNLKNVTTGLTTTIGNLNEGTSGIKSTMSEIQQGAEGFKDNMEAAKHNFLLKGYFAKKEKEKQQALKKAKQDSIQNAAAIDTMSIKK